jgi:hypothetical protein
MNIIKTKVKPESPNVIPGAQYHIYAPIVSSNQAGLATFDKSHFTVDGYGVVRLNSRYSAELVGGVALHPIDVSKVQNIQSPIEVTYLTARQFVNSTLGVFDTLSVYDYLQVGDTFIGASDDAQLNGIATRRLHVDQIYSYSKDEDDNPVPLYIGNNITLIGLLHVFGETDGSTVINDGTITTTDKVVVSGLNGTAQDSVVITSESINVNNSVKIVESGITIYGSNVATEQWVIEYVAEHGGSSIDPQLVETMHKINSGGIV